jgi:protein subunit release factor B
MQGQDPAALSERRLSERLRLLGIREQDLEESFVRSRGKGGQNVNKVATCVVLRHLPSGLQVKCQEERSQALNRRRARELLADKIEEQRRARERSQAAAAAKRRRQARRRSRASKEKMLAEKRTRAKIKTLRRRVRTEED